jgi:hypothetical protein
MKVFAALVAVIAACVLSGCTRTIDGAVAQTIEPLTVDGMRCAEFNTLGDRDRTFVVDEILAGASADRPAFVAGLARVMCQMLPEAEVKQVLISFKGR